MEECYQKELFDYIKDKFVSDLDEHEDYGFFFFDKKFYKVYEVKKKGRTFFDSLEEKMNDMSQNYAFVFSFREGQKKLHIYSIESGELLPAFYDFLPRYERKTFKNLKFRSFDVVLFLNQNCHIQKKPMKETNLTTIPLVNV